MTLTRREPDANGLNLISGAIIEAAIQVHSQLGPGLLESASEACLLYELQQHGYMAVCQVLLPIKYRDVQIDAGYRIDLMVEDAVIVELKVVESLLPIHQAQLLCYLKLSGKRLGLLLNFNTTLLKHGIVRLVNEI